MPLLFDKLVLLAKREVTYATDPTPVAGDAVLAFDVEITPFEANDIERRPATPWFRAAEQIPAGRHVILEFSVEASSSGAAGTAPAHGSALLRGSGHAEVINVGVDVQYNLISAAYESATLYWFMDGQRHRVLGWRGSMRFEARANQRPMHRFRGIGLYTGPTASAPPAPSFTAWRKPQIVSQAQTPTMTIHGTAVVLRSLSIDLGQRVVHRDLVGSESVQILGRSPSGEALIEAPALGTKDWFASAAAETLGALQMIHGVGAGNIVQVDAPQVKVMKPAYQNEDGAAMLRLGLNILPSAGDDEIKFTFK